MSKHFCYFSYPWEYFFCFGKLGQIWNGLPRACLLHPFYDNGPNDLGIGWNLLISLRRVAIGYTLASIIAVPLGILVGISEVAFKAFNPYFQLLKPVSPLAWLPIGLYLFRDSELTGIFIITIASIWPTLTNTAFGVANVVHPVGGRSLRSLFLLPCLISSQACGSVWVSLGW